MTISKIMPPRSRFPFFAMLAMTVMIFMALAQPSHAQTEIVITEGRIVATPIAISTFIGQTPEEVIIARNITEVTRADLQSSDLFESIDEGRFLERIHNPDSLPDFPAWRGINAHALVTGRVVDVDGRDVRIEFRLWDVFSAKQLFGLQLATEKKYWRRLAHIVADKVYERLSGESGYFDSKIAYVSETGGKGDRHKQLIIMDQDGENAQPLSNDENLVLTPRFSPSGEEVVYLSYEDGNPRVYILSLETGRKGVVGTFPGLSFAPRFSPDGRFVIMSLAEGGNANIHVLDLRSRETYKLTNTLAINTSPSYSPNGSQIAFESDRGGTQQIYVMNANGSYPRRISFGDGRYASPVWSPRGDWIAFIKQWRGEFFVGVMSPDGANERILARGFHNEGPTWSPNGRVLLFFRENAGETGGPSLWRVGVNGDNPRRVPTSTFASDPSWSPLLHQIQTPDE